MRVAAYVIVLLNFVALTACGGGSSNGDTAVPSSEPVPTNNEPPIAADQFQSTALTNDEFIAVGDFDDIQKLFKINTATLQATELSQNVVSGGKIQRAEVSPDATKIAYLADHDRNNTYELFVSNTDGSINHKLSTVCRDSIFECAVNQFDWSPNSEYVQFSGSRDAIPARARTRFIVDFTGDIVRDLGVPQNETLFAWSPNGNEYIYAQSNTLHRSNITTGASSTFVGDDFGLSIEDGAISELQWQSGDGSIYFTINSDLYSLENNAFGTSNAKLIAENVRGFEPSVNGFVVFISDGDGGLEIFLHDGTDNILVDRASCVSQGISGAYSINLGAWSSSGRYYHYREEFNNDCFNLGLIDTESNPIKVNLDLPTNMEIDSAQISPDEQQLAFSSGDALHLTRLADLSDRTIQLPLPRATNLKWFPDSKKLFSYSITGAGGTRIVEVDTEFNTAELLLNRLNLDFDLDCIYLHGAGTSGSTCFSFFDFR